MYAVHFDSYINLPRVILIIIKNELERKVLAKDTRVILT